MSLQILDFLNLWHLVIFFYKKSILVETQYKIYNGNPLDVVEAFST